MREQQPNHSILVLVVGFFLSSWAQANIWNPNAPGYAECQAQVNAHKGYMTTQGQLQEIMANCMENASAEERARQADEYAARVDEEERARQAQAQRNARRGSNNSQAAPQPAASVPAQAAAPASEKAVCDRTCPASTGMCMPESPQSTRYVCTPNNKANEAVAASTADSACVAKADQLLAACEGQYNDTATSCDSENNSTMSNVVDTASKVGNMIAAGTSASISAACGQMGTLSSAANGAVSVYRYNCMNNVSSCKSSCAEVTAFLKDSNYCMSQTATVVSAAANSIKERAKETTKMCGAFDEKVAEAQNAMNNLMKSALTASQCSALTSGTDMASLCAANPSLIGCSNLAAVDCSNPTMASNRVCVCAANPLDPSCGAGQNANSNPNAISNGWMGGSASGGTAGLGGLDMGGDLAGLPGIEQGKASAGGDSAVDGKQGGGANIGGGSGGGGLAGGAGGAGAGGEDSGTQVTAGFYGGGGGSFGGSRYGGARGGAGGAGGVGPDGRPLNPDLRQFLPGGKYDPKFRGIAGMTGPDGITGPHTNIWQKVQNRYQVMSPSLLP